MMKITLPAATACLIVVLFTGCAALSSLIKKQETLEERVKGYMQAQIDKEWDRAYSFFDSASRKEVPRGTYLNQPRKLSYTGFRIEEITVLPSGDQATVRVRIDLLFMGYEFKGDKGGPERQEWVKEKGAWFVKAPHLAQAAPMGQPRQDKK